MALDTFVPKTDDEFANPDFSIEKYPISARFLMKEELPENLDDLGDYSRAYALFQKLDNGKYKEQILDLHTFTLYLRQMYRKAREEGTVLSTSYNGEEYLDFPIENMVNKVRLYASFIPNNKFPGRWFCLGIRPGSKIHDFATLGNVTIDYNVVKHIFRLSDLGIESKFALREHVEDAFIDAILNNEIYRCTIEGKTLIEFPVNLVTKDGAQLYTMQLECLPDQPRWKFVSYKCRCATIPLEEGIRKGVCRNWRKEYQADVATIKEKEELVKKEKEFLLKEAEKQLIKFHFFYPIKIEADIEEQNTYSITAFTHITNPPLLFLPEHNIDIRNPDIVMEAIEEAFARCNPYQDIDYYQYSSGDIAELRIQVPGYESVPLYTSFVRNQFSGFQPWHLRQVLMYQDVYHRTLFVPDYEKTLEEIKELSPSCTLTSASELEEYMDARFMEAISKNEMFFYGNPKNFRLELPLKIGGLHAVFAESGRSIPWVLIEVRIRTGEDVRFCISNEYKTECVTGEKPKPIPKKVVAASPAEVKEEKPQFKGESVLDGSGTPLDLPSFSRQISLQMLHLLADMAEEEQWGFSFDENPYFILLQYLNERFIRLGYEGKIGIHHGHNCDEYAAFHTGLFSRDFHDPIYACFLPQFHDEYYTGPLWRLDGFCCRTEGGEVYNRLIQFFPSLPTDANFMMQDGNYLPSWKYMMDPHLPISLREEHILRERGYRLPSDFLLKVFKKCKDSQAIEYLKKLDALEIAAEKKSFWISEFSPYLESATETYDYLLYLMEFVVQEARDCNIRQPIPAYYPRDNKMSWLLPLRFHEDSNLKNLVLIVSAKESGGYKGMTILNIEEVYHHARTITNPDCSWLRREILDNYQCSEVVEEEFEEEE